jgi:hypothetical protein
MRYILILLILIVNYYPLTYGKYLWNTGKRSGALGVMLIVAVSTISFVIYSIVKGNVFG